MKRFTALLLAFSLLLTLASCSSEPTAHDPDTPPTTPSPSAEPTLHSDESTEKVPDANKPSEQSKPEEDTSKGQGEISFEEVTVVDNEQCVIKITGIDPDSMWGYTLKAYLENKSADKTYMFSINSAAINGVQTQALFGTEVTAGKKANEEISFGGTELSENGIEPFTDIELSFVVYDSDDWMADSVAEETVHIYPLGEENATAFVRESQSTDTVVVDNDSVSVIVTGYSEDEIFGYTVNLYLVNKTDRELTYGVDEASVNGFMADPFWATSVGAGKVSFTSMSWPDSSFEENGITDVEEIEMKLRIYPSDDWTEDALFDDTITLHP